jgi:predicted nucleic acid-binding protein
VTVYYLDASAWVKRYLQEDGTIWVQDVFAQQQTLACASLGYIEVNATLARKHKAGDITADQFAEKIRELDEDWRGIIEVRLVAEVVADAKDLATRIALRGADAIHLASAITLRRRLSNGADDVAFVAADEELKAAAHAAGFTVLDPVEQQRLAGR